MSNELQPRFQPIDPVAWPRQPYFDHYFHTVRCTYSVVATVDVTSMLARCKTAGVKFTPAMIHCISTAVNRIPEMRVSFDGTGSLGTWDFMTPCYAVFHRDDNTFSNLWTAYSDDFSIFYQRFTDDNKRYGDDRAFFPKPDMPGNYFTISFLPWIDFTGFNINVSDDGAYLRPIFTVGKFVRENGTVLVPLAVQAHHAVCDGYHVGQFFEHLRTLAAESAHWLLPGAPE